MFPALRSKIYRSFLIIPGPELDPLALLLLGARAPPASLPSQAHPPSVIPTGRIRDCAGPFEALRHPGDFRERKLAGWKLLFEDQLRLEEATSHQAGELNGFPAQEKTWVGLEDGEARFGQPRGGTRPVRPSPGSE